MSRRPPINLRIECPVCGKSCALRVVNRDVLPAMHWVLQPEHHDPDRNDKLCRGSRTKIAVAAE